MIRLLVAASLLCSCAVLHDAFVEDRSTWSQAMRDDVNDCDREVVEGRWGWGTMAAFRRPGEMKFPRSFSDARILCLREKGWRL